MSAPKARKTRTTPPERKPCSRLRTSRISESWDDELAVAAATVIGSVSAIRRDERHVRTSADRCKMLHYRRRPSGPATDESTGAANTFRRSCTDSVWAVANAAWLSLLMDRLRRVTRQGDGG